jgi:hypothetical protein
MLLSASAVRPDTCDGMPVMGGDGKARGACGGAIVGSGAGAAMRSGSGGTRLGGGIITGAGRIGGALGRFGGRSGLALACDAASRPPITPVADGGGGGATNAGRRSGASSLCDR